ncbi:ERGIC-53 protein [Thecamonas trahens ATCC 50062]|uniref:ERGIC-53 protein n=1 Tax=Thecamonas trahens ATCC 50062 TaxID=461836 RepID=A0A0L0DKF0_THETB|nr:ERGIC-53 protein [Thecamonas trahens ATCC 50062]KNC51843.1 ERGIC-53 protein [Thecamonas trahens ATCC 50062]|eukprot:XP_013755708.1 ERGIC-53 protein [Thecamonas trahens ATCC 50062]
MKLSPSVSGALALALVLVLAVTAEEADHLIPYGSYVERHSFQAPLADGKVPFWSLGAGARVEDGAKVRLTPARQSRLGYCWNDAPTTLTDWEVTISFQVTGQPALGGDGFALWFTSKAGMMGPVYGGMDYWDGLGIFFDTFNNDGSGAHPAIVAVMNDGSLSYDQATDGASQALASCQASFRNLDYPSQVRVIYQYGTLSLSHDVASNGNWVECFSVQNVELGIDKYFGLTAGTGDLADNHDVFSFNTRSLTPANVDLDAIRSRFKSKHDHYNMAAGSSQPMAQDTFQNEVLKMLHQIQSTANVIESNAVSLKNAMEGGMPRRGMPDRVPASGGSVDGIARQLNDLASRLSEAISSRTSPSLVRISDTLSAVQSAVSNLHARSSSSATGGSADAGAIASTVRSEVNAAIRDLPTSAALARIVAEAVADGAGANSGGGGWLFAIAMFIAGLLAGWGVSAFVAKSSRSAYKLP